MLRNASANEHFDQAQLSFDQFTDGQPHLTPHQHQSVSDLPALSSEAEFQAFMLPVKPLTGENQQKIASFSRIVQRSFEIRRMDVAGHIVNHFEASFRDFWNKRCHQYSCPDRFRRRVAKVFNLSVDQVRATQAYLNLPDCTSQSVRNFDQHRFGTCLFLDANEHVHDPLDRFYGRTIQRASTMGAWERYLSEYAFLSPDMIDISDIRFLLKNYPISLQRAAMLLQLRDSELSDFAADHDFPTSYRSSALPIRDLLGHSKHQRLTQIVLKCAHQAYTYQAVPLRVIAERIGIDVSQLFEMGEREVSDWVHPQLSTIHHVIEYVTLMHVQAGGVLRQNVAG